MVFRSSDVMHSTNSSTPRLLHHVYRIIRAIAIDDSTQLHNYSTSRAKDKNNEKAASVELGMDSM